MAGGIVRGWRPIAVCLALASAIGLAAAQERPARDALPSATPLVKAVARKDVRAVRALLDAGADPNVKCAGVDDADETTALHEAVDQEHLGIVKLLLDRGADVNAVVGDDLLAGMSPLIFAAYLDDPEIARELLRAGAQADLEDNRGMNALGAAAMAGNEAVAVMLLDAGVDVDSPDWFGVTPLMVAVAEEHVGMVKLLLARGADVHARDDATRREYFKADFVGAYGKTLHLAASGRMKERRSDGASVLDHARAGGNREIIRLLLEAGAEK